MDISSGDSRCSAVCLMRSMRQERLQRHYLLSLSAAETGNDEAATPEAKGFCRATTMRCVSAVNAVGSCEWHAC